MKFAENESVAMVTLTLQTCRSGVHFNYRTPSAKKLSANFGIRSDICKTFNNAYSPSISPFVSTFMHTFITACVLLNF